MTLIRSFLSAICACTAVTSAYAAAQAGTGYTLKLSSSGPAFPITSIDFGTQNSVSNGQFSSGNKLSPITVTFNVGGAQVSELARDCAVAKLLPKVVSTYSVNGTPDLDIEFTNVVVTGIKFPSVDNGKTAPGDITVTFTARKEEMVDPQPAPTSSNARVFRRQLPKVQQKWMALPMRLSVAPSGNFSLTLSKMDISGVTGINAFGVVTPTDAATGLVSGKAKYDPLTLTVDATKASLFSSYAASHKLIPSGTLVLYRKDANGVETSVKLSFKNLAVQSTAFSGQAGSAPSIVVTLSYSNVTFE